MGAGVGAEGWAMPEQGLGLRLRYREAGTVVLCPPGPFSVHAPYTPHLRFHTPLLPPAMLFPPTPCTQTLRTFLGKAFGVSFAIGSGLFAGKEGPFIVSAHGCIPGANSLPQGYQGTRLRLAKKVHASHRLWVVGIQLSQLRCGAG